MIVGKKTKIRCEVAFSEDMAEDVTDQLIGREVVFDKVRFAFRQKMRMLYLSAET